jgi:hypothetical protein
MILWLKIEVLSFGIEAILNSTLSKESLSEA